MTYRNARRRELYRAKKPFGLLDREWKMLLGCGPLVLLILVIGAIVRACALVGEGVGAVISQAEETPWPFIGGAVVIVALVAVLLVLIVMIKRNADRNRQTEIADRFAALSARWGQQIAHAICQHQLWQGQTMDLVIESIGQPAWVEEEVTPAGAKHVWSYYPDGYGRYGLTVNLQGGLVTGWRRG